MPDANVTKGSVRILVDIIASNLYKRVINVELATIKELGLENQKLSKNPVSGFKIGQIVHSEHPAWKVSSLDDKFVEQFKKTQARLEKLQNEKGKTELYLRALIKACESPADISLLLMPRLQKGWSERFAKRMKEGQATLSNEQVQAFNKKYARSIALIKTRLMTNLIQG